MRTNINRLLLLSDLFMDDDKNPHIYYWKPKDASLEKYKNPKWVHMHGLWINLKNPFHLAALKNDLLFCRYCDLKLNECTCYNL